MTSQNDDCYFFYYSKCIKGELCPFRHEPAALGKEQICAAWSNGFCNRASCPDRHMIINKNRTQTPCFWETQPGGCQKPHCVFFHRKSTQAPQRMVAVPKAAAAGTTTVAEGAKDSETVHQRTAGGADVDQKSLAAPIPTPVAAEVPPKVPEAPVPVQKRPDVAGSRKVVTSLNGVTSPKKVVAKAEESIGNIKDRLRGLEDSEGSSSKQELEFGVKTLEQIHREKALASMRKKQDDAPVQPNNHSRKADLVTGGRKIIIKTGGNSEGEISDSSPSPGRKVEVTTSDTENGRVKGNVKCRLGPTAGQPASPRNGDLTPDDDSSKVRTTQEVRVVKAVTTEILSPSKRLRKRKPEPEAVRQLEPVSKFQRIAAKKQVKPAMEIYRPPRAGNPIVEPCVVRAPAANNKTEAVAESSDVPIKKRLEFKSSVVRKSPEEKPVVATNSLLKKPLLRNAKQDEGRPLEKVKVKTLDEILAEKRKKMPEEPVGCSVGRSAQMPLTSVVDAASNAETKRCLPRKRASPESGEPATRPDDELSEQKHSTLRLLKRRKLSMENHKNQPQVNGHTEVGEEEVRRDEAVGCVSDASLEGDKQKIPEGKESLLLEVDSLLDDDFLLGEVSDSFCSSKVIKDDDELFQEIQSLLQ